MRKRLSVVPKSEITSELGTILPLNVASPETLKVPATSSLAEGVDVPTPTRLVSVFKKTLVPLYCQPETLRLSPEAPMVTVLLSPVEMAIPSPAVKVRTELEEAAVKVELPTAIFFQEGWVLVIVGVCPGVIEMPSPAVRE